MTDRLLAFDALLALPDPPEMPVRRHRLTCAGDPRRRERITKPLAVAFLQYHFVAKDPPPYIGHAKPARIVAFLKRA